MKIHILGASGSGVTTLGKLLAAETNIPYFDSDDYFWEESEIPYTIKRNKEERNSNLHRDLKKSDDWILGGSIMQWGDDLIPLFDLVIFLWVPKNLRLARLHQRELERYGNIILTDATRNAKHNAFIEWAAGYDNSLSKGRTLLAHEHWLKKIPCTTLELRGDFSIEDRLELCIRDINKIGKYYHLGAMDF